VATITWEHFTGNQSGLLKAVETHFQPQQSAQQLNKGHGRIEKRENPVNPSRCFGGLKFYKACSAWNFAILVRCKSPNN
jgi:hypothetical protein